MLVRAQSGASAGFVIVGKVTLFLIDERSFLPFSLAPKRVVYSGSDFSKISETPKSAKRITRFILAKVYREV